MDYILRHCDKYHEWCEVHISFPVTWRVPHISGIQCWAAAHNFMNNINTKSRNKFGGFQAEILMPIKSYLSDEFEFALDSVYSFWKSEKRDDKRREGQRIAHNNNYKW
jgi:hypothetical protein